MKFLSFQALVGAFAVLVSCSADIGGAGQDHRYDVHPSEFALLPCAEIAVAGRCVLVVAGGKNILFGAPSEVARRLDRQRLANLDAVVLFSLAAEDIDGLDEVRNESWRAGRRAPLQVAGPQGTATVIAAINSAFEPADALRVVEEGLPPGGFDAAVLVGVDPGLEGGNVFDTGDLVVSGSAEWAIGLAGTVSVIYRGTHRLDLLPCGAGGQGATVEVGAIRLGCNDETDALSWPLTDAYYIVREPRQ